MSQTFGASTNQLPLQLTTDIANHLALVCHQTTRTRNIGFLKPHVCVLETTQTWNHVSSCPHQSLKLGPCQADLRSLGISHSTYFMVTMHTSTHDPWATLGSSWASRNIKFESYWCHPPHTPICDSWAILAWSQALQVLACKSNGSCPVHTNAWSSSNFGLPLGWSTSKIQASFGVALHTSMLDLGAILGSSWAHCKLIMKSSCEHPAHINTASLGQLGLTLDLTHSCMQAILESPDAHPHLKLGPSWAHLRNMPLSDLSASWCHWSDHRQG